MREQSVRCESDKGRMAGSKSFEMWGGQCGTDARSLDRMGSRAQIGGEPDSVVSVGLAVFVYAQPGCMASVKLGSCMT